MFVGHRNTIMTGLIGWDRIASILYRCLQTFVYIKGLLRPRELSTENYISLVYLLRVQLHQVHPNVLIQIVSFVDLCFIQMPLKRGRFPHFAHFEWAFS